MVRALPAGPRTDALHGVPFGQPAHPALVRMPALVLCAAGYGIALAWIGVRIAARAAEQRLPDLYQIAVRSKL